MHISLKMSTEDLRLCCWLSTFIQFFLNIFWNIFNCVGKPRIQHYKTIVTYSCIQVQYPSSTKTASWSLAPSLVKWRPPRPVLHQIWHKKRVFVVFCLLYCFFLTPDKISVFSAYKYGNHMPWCIPIARGSPLTIRLTMNSMKLHRRSVDFHFSKNSNEQSFRIFLRLLFYEK